MLTGPDGALAAARRRHDLLDHEHHLGSSCVADVGAEAAALGVAVLDCGVTGGPAAAASGDMVCMVGGDAETIERLEPVFDAISSLIVRMGPFGAGLPPSWPGT